MQVNPLVFENILHVWAGLYLRAIYYTRLLTLDSNKQYFFFYTRLLTSNDRSAPRNEAPSLGDEYPT